jgi:hypothetical protein
VVGEIELEQAMGVTSPKAVVRLPGQLEVGILLDGGGELTRAGGGRDFTGGGGEATCVGGGDTTGGSDEATCTVVRSLSGAELVYA